MSPGNCPKICSTHRMSYLGICYSSGRTKERSAAVLRISKAGMEQMLSMSITLSQSLPKELPR